MVTCFMALHEPAAACAQSRQIQAHHEAVRAEEVCFPLSEYSILCMAREQGLIYRKLWQVASTRWHVFYALEAPGGLHSSEHHAHERSQSKAHAYQLSLLTRGWKGVRLWQKPEAGTRAQLRTLSGNARSSQERVYRLGSVGHDCCMLLWDLIVPADGLFPNMK